MFPNQQDNNQRVRSRIITQGLLNRVKNTKKFPEWENKYYYVPALLNQAGAFFKYYLTTVTKSLTCYIH